MDERAMTQYKVNQAGGTVLICACSGCDLLWEDWELMKIPASRATPRNIHGEMPQGLCPECDALVYPLCCCMRCQHETCEA